MQIIPLF